MSSTREIKMNICRSKGAYKIGLGWAHGWRRVLLRNRGECEWLGKRREEGTTPLVKILNHSNSVTTALCKCTQWFITVTAVIAVGFLEARWDFHTKIPCFFSLLQRCCENHCLLQEKHPKLNRASF